MKEKWLQGAALWLAGAIMTLPAAAQTYPVKPVKFVVNYTPGGPADLVARTMGARMGEALGQSVVIENMPSTNGAIGSVAVARAAPDGYTLLFASAGHTSLVAALYRERLPFDPFNDFLPVSMLDETPQIIVAHPGIKVRTIAELVQLAKGRPGQLNYGSVGVGSGNHLGMELLKAMARIDLVHVPYKGTAPVMQDLLAGRVQLALNGMATVVPYVKSGKLVALAMSTRKRSPALPDVPTMIESGFAGFDVGSWHALLAPLKTPAPVIARLNAAAHQAASDPQIVKALASQGVEPEASTPEFVSKLMRDEYERWRRVITEANIVAE